MALTTYTELKAAVADWLNRGDLTSIIPDFITLAETEFNRSVRTRDMLTVATASISAESTALPAGFRQFKYIHLTDAVAGEIPKIDITSPEELDVQRLLYYNTASIPKIGAIVGSNLVVAPSPATTYAVSWAFYTAITALSGSNATNWLLTKHPDLYLYGSLLHSAPYLKDDERVPLWAAAYQRALDAIRTEEDRMSLGGSAPRMRARPF